jgi:hypothetical protein
MENVSALNGQRSLNIYVVPQEDPVFILLSLHARLCETIQDLPDMMTDIMIFQDTWMFLDMISPATILTLTRLWIEGMTEIE